MGALFARLLVGCRPPVAWKLLVCVFGGIIWCSSSPAGRPAEGRSALYEGFEGPEVSWQQAGGDTPYRMEFHGRVQGQAHVGQGCERVRLVAGHGSYVYLAHPIGCARIIDELLISVWVKSDRAGIQLLAQVVLPRSVQPRTGEQLTTLIRGTTYTQVGRWEQLRLENLPQQLARQVRILRSQYGPQVDEREAYVSHVLLNIYGGPGVTNLWIDDLDVAGLIETKPSATAPRAISAPLFSRPGGGSEAASPRIAGAPIGASGPSSPVANPPSSFLSTAGAEPWPVRLEGSILQVQGRPFFPRILQYQGEALELVQQLGFNVLWLASEPTPELLAKAERLDLWLICPPPISRQPPPAEEASSIHGIREKIPPEFDRVLAWDVTLEPPSARLTEIARWAERVRRAESRSTRPLVARASENLQPLSRVVDIIWLSRGPSGSGLELSEYASWLRDRELLVRPGTPLWLSIPTQLPASVRTQWRLMSSARVGEEKLQIRGNFHPEIPENLEPEQIRLGLYVGLAGGVRGVAYESDRPLDCQAPETQLRAATLELLNRETEVVEPWLAAGGRLAGVQASQPHVQGALLKTERARLAILFWTGPAAEYLVGQAAAEQLSFLLPGLPDAHEAYQIAGGRLQPLRRERTAGGTRIHLEEFDLSTVVLFSQDPMPVSVTTQRALAQQRRLAQLHHLLATEKLRQIQQLWGRLPPQLLSPQSKSEPFLGPMSPPSSFAKALQLAQEQMNFCTQRLQNRDYGAAILAAQRAHRAVRFLERRIWEAATQTAESPAIWPLACCFRMVPEHWEMIRQVRYATPEPNRLPAGDFEDFQAMVSSGWSRGENHSEIATGFVELSPQAARSGRFGLRLATAARDPQSPPEILDLPPIWVISPPVPCPPGQLVRIQGWVQVPQPIHGCVDGLMIADSFGGESLAWRIRKTAGWQPFEMYRMVPEGGRLQIRFVLTGLGEVWLDDIIVQALEWGSLGRGG
ncbi:MAG: hypothetical protein NZ602_08670 [Thermoguttaceae bacterium]|nr:hypothetical protein [Thermoguttaceae bacterium]MDW8036474.1 hypothetical protein [Thermoguttaceae bacterium]